MIDIHTNQVIILDFKQAIRSPIRSPPPTIDINNHFELILAPSVQFLAETQRRNGMTLCMCLPV